MELHLLLSFIFRQDASFEVDFIPLLASLGLIVLFYFFRERKNQFVIPHLHYSNIKSFDTKNYLSEIGINLPQNILMLSFLFLLFAWSDPRFLIAKHRENSLNEPPKSSVEGLAIYLVLDQSGSMAEEISYGGGTKVNLLKRVTKQFIAGDPQTGLEGRPNDMIGLIVFARGAHVLSPLTLDHTALLSELATFAPIAEKEQDGTSIGYAIFKTASMIAATKHYAQGLIEKGEPAYTIKNTMMILITDGMQDPNPLDKGKRLRNMDIPEAAAYAKSQGVRLYIVNVEPRMALDEFEPHRHVMQRAAELTGGKFYLVDATTNLEKIYKDIDSLEKSEVPAALQKLDKDRRPDLYRRLSFSPYLISLGLLLLLFNIVLEALVFRRIP
jgi:Ca-activated chloride channel family protein